MYVKAHKNVPIEYVAYIQSGIMRFITTLKYSTIRDLFAENRIKGLYEGEKVQRSRSKSRTRKVGQYISTREAENRYYYLPPVTLAIFTGGEDNIGFNTNKGKIPRGSDIVVIDGQHRLIGIRDLLNEEKHRKHDCESIGVSVIFAGDAEEMQQVFADVNWNASKPSKSLTLYFDRSNQFNRSVVKIINSSPTLSKWTDVEKTTISGKSDMVFTPSMVHTAVRALFSCGPSQALSEEEITEAVEVFEYLRSTDIWPCFRKPKHRITPADMRRDYASCHTVFIEALMRTIAAVKEHQKDQSWKDTIGRICWMPWSKENKILQNRCVVNGKMRSTKDSSFLTSAALKQQLDLPLLPVEREAETKVRALQMARQVTKTQQKGESNA